MKFMILPLLTTAAGLITVQSTPTNSSVQCPSIAAILDGADQIASLTSTLVDLTNVTTLKTALATVNKTLEETNILEKELDCEKHVQNRTEHWIGKVLCYHLSIHTPHKLGRIHHALQYIDNTMEELLWYDENRERFASNFREQFHLREHVQSLQDAMRMNLERCLDEGCFTVSEGTVESLD